MEKINAINEENVENKIIDLIVMGSGNRLIVFKPEDDLKGADLVVKKRGLQRNEVFFKIYSFIGPSAGSSFSKDILQQNFISEKDLYLIFAYFDEVGQEISDYIWVIPSMEFKDIADRVSISGKKAFRFKSCLDIKEKSKYSKFLVSKKELGKLLVNLLKPAYQLNYQGGLI